MEPDSPVPAFLTVEEMARVARIGRTTAYELAREDLATGGGKGLRVVQFGRQLRIPRVAIEQMVGGPFEIPTTTSKAPPADPASVEPPTPLKAAPTSPRRANTTSTDQPTFPFAS